MSREESSAPRPGPEVPGPAAVQEEAVLDAELVEDEQPAAGPEAGDPDSADVAEDPAGEAAAPPAETQTQTPAEEPDYKDRYLRAAADMENLRKRARRDVGVADARGVARLAKELLPALDNLDRALAAAEAAEGDDEHTLTRGIRLVQSELAAALTRVGITAEIPLGAPFDPHRHEALTQQPKENTAPGLVIDVYQPGYVYGDTVLRAAKVVVSA